MLNLFCSCTRKPTLVNLNAQFILQLYEEAYFGQLPPDVGGTLLNLAMAYVRLDDTESNRAESLYLR